MGREWKSKAEMEPSLRKQRDKFLLPWRTPQALTGRRQGNFYWLLGISQVVSSCQKALMKLCFSSVTTRNRAFPGGREHSLSGQACGLSLGETQAEVWRKTYSMQTDPRFQGALGLCLPPQGVPSKTVDAFVFCLAREYRFWLSCICTRHFFFNL